MRFSFFPTILRVCAGSFILLWGAACTPASPVLPSQTVEPTSTSTYTPIVESTNTPTPISSRTPSPTPTPLPEPYVCSPLNDVTLSQLQGIITNPFVLNTPGLDDGHHGTDFAYYRFGSHVGMAGLPIRSAMPGRVVALINNRPPYGNAIIIETPFRYLSQTWLNQMDLPSPGPYAEPQPAMNCPTLLKDDYRLNGEKSLYLLYAHMQTSSPLTLGTTVACGQEIGKVGTTGESVNEHLHLETRVGPAGASFSSLAYYDTGRTEEEAINYCIWRVTNVFHLFDPMDLFVSGSSSQVEP